MKIRGDIFFLGFLIFLLPIVSCASSDSSEAETVPVVEVVDVVENLENQPTEKPATEAVVLPSIPKKSTYFEFSDSSIMQDAEKGSPQGIKNVISKLRKSNGKYTEEETVLFAVLQTISTNVWPSEIINFPILESLPENVYIGIIEYIEKGLFDTNAGKSDFYTLVLPCVVLCTSSQTSFFQDAEENLLEALEKNENSVLVHYLLVK